MYYMLYLNEKELENNLEVREIKFVIYGFGGFSNDKLSLMGLF